MRLIKLATMILLLGILTMSCAVRSRVVPITEPVCEAREEIFVEYGTQEWLNAMGLNLVKMQQCILKYQAVIRAHNND